MWAAQLGNDEALHRYAAGIGAFLEYMPLRESGLLSAGAGCAGKPLYRSFHLNFIKNNNISNVVFLTTDSHAGYQNEVFRDRFENGFNQFGQPNPPTTIAYELVTGPIATFTLQQEILLAFGLDGPTKLEQFNQALDLAGVDCRDLNRDSYGVVSVDATAGTASVALKDDQGNAVTNKRGSSFPCTVDQGPQPVSQALNDPASRPSWNLLSSWSRENQYSFSAAASSAASSSE